MNVAVKTQPEQLLAQEAIAHIHQCAQNQLPSFLSAYSLISSEAAQLGWLLSYLINKQLPEPGGYKTFFANSGLESLHGAIKLVKHYDNSIKHRSPKVLVVSNNQALVTVLPSDHVPSMPDLYPHLNAVAESEGLLALSDDPGLTAVVYAPSSIPDHCLYRSLFEHCVENDKTFIVDTSVCTLGRIDSLLACHRHKPDIVVWGESIGHGVIPFGAFTACDRVYAPWNNLPNCLIHSSTFGGNNLALSFAIKQILSCPNYQNKTEIMSKQLALIGQSNRQTIQYFTEHANPCSQLLFKITRMDPLFDRAHGMSLSYSKDGQTIEVLDCLGGGGCNVKGHNSMEFANALLHNHDPQKDYWGHLSAELKSFTGLYDAFPAVSGASAVEIALTLGLGANAGKKTLITFDGNYAGKSLVSLSATGMPGMRQPFEPLYPNVVFIDPKAEDAATQLEQELDKGQTALIWFEYMQGIDNTQIKDELIDIINRRKAKDGYFVGIDEILNGLYRMGHFLSPGDKIKPDIVTFSKGLSGMLVPVAACLVSQTVSQNMQKQYPEVYRFYLHYYQNQVGAHMGCIVLQYLKDNKIGENVKQVGSYLKLALQQFAGPDKLLAEVKGDGLNLYLKMNDKVFPLNLFSKITTIGRPMGSMMFTHICMRRGNLLPFFNRFTPPLNCTKAQADVIINKVEKILSINPWQLLFIGLGQVMRIFLVSKYRALKQMFNPSNNRR